jgi:hypothetical protein
MTNRKIAGSNLDEARAVRVHVRNHLPNQGEDVRVISQLYRQRGDLVDHSVIEGILLVV